MGIKTASGSGITLDPTKLRSWTTGTVMIWAYLTGGSANERDLIGEYQNFNIQHVPGSSQFWGQYGVNGSGIKQIVYSDSGFLNKWTHYALSYDNANLILYIDGIERVRTSFTGGYSNASSFPFTIGYIIPSYYCNSSFFDGRAYSVGLTASEINTIYNSKGCDNIIRGLRARWKLDEKPLLTTASGSLSVIDISGNGNHMTPVSSPVYCEAPMITTRRA